MDIANFIELDAESYADLPKDVQKQIWGYMLEEGFEDEDYASKAEGFEAFIEDYFSVYFHAGDLKVDQFCPYDGGIVVINGSLSAGYINLYGIGTLYISGNIEADSLVLADSSLYIGGNATIQKYLILSDTGAYLEIAQTLKTANFVCTFDSKYIKIGSIDGTPATYLTKDSYSQYPKGQIFELLGLPAPVTMTEEQHITLWKTLN